MMGSHDIDVHIDSESLLKDEGIIPRAAKELLRFDDKLSLEDHAKQLKEKQNPVQVQ